MAQYAPFPLTLQLDIMVNDDKQQTNIKHNTQDEVAIMARAKSDLTAFAPLYETYFPKVYHFCLRRVNNPQEAEDLTSHIFSQILRNIEGYQGGSVRAWIFTIARNTVVNHYRARKTAISLEGAEIDIADNTYSPSILVMENEQNQAIRAIVDTLPPDERELLSLKINAGLSAEEIGKVLGKKAGTVRVMLHRIIKRLRAVYLEELK